MYEKYKIEVTNLNYIDPINTSRDFSEMSNLPSSVLQNKLIDVYKSVLTDDKVISDVMNPIDLPFMANDIKNLNGVDKKEDLSSFDAISQLETKFQFSNAESGLGQNVNSLVDSIRGSMANLYLINHYLGGGHFDEKKQTVFDKEFSVKLSNKDKKDYVKDYNSKESDNTKHITLEDVNKLESISLNDSMTALVNAFVDAVKDPFIVKGNWTTQTNNIGFMMLRAGIHPFYVNAFLKQPVIQDYVSFVTNMESKVIDSTNKILQEFKLKFIYNHIDPSEKYEFDINDEIIVKNKRELFKRLFTLENIKFFDNPSSEKYETSKDLFTNKMMPVKIAEILGLKREEKGKNKRFPKEQFEQLQEVSYDLIREFEKVFEVESDKEYKDFSLGELREQITNPIVEEQVALLKVFLDFQEIAKQPTKNVKASKFDVDGPGKNISSLFINLNIIDELRNNTEDKTFGGFETKLEYDGESTMLNSLMENSLYIPYQIMRANPKFFLTADDAILTTFNEVSNFIYGNNLQGEKLADKLENSYYSYLMSDFGPLKMTQDEKRDILITVPEKLRKFQRKYPKNTLLQKLYETKGDSLKLAKNDEEFKDKKFYKNFYISFPNLKSSKTVKDAIVDSWSDLMRLEPEFSEDLIKYVFLTTGFNNNINAFQQFIPAEWFNKNRFNSFLKNSRDTEQKIDMNYIDQFFRNLYYDRSVTKKIYFGEQNGIYKIDNINMNTSFKSEKNKGYLVMNESGDRNDPMSKVYENYYKLHGVDLEGNFIYIRTSPLGWKDTKGNKIFEYSKDQYNLLTNVHNNKLNAKKINLDHWNEIYRNEDINIINNERSEVTRETFANDQVTEKVNEISKSSIINKNDDRYNLEILLTDIAARKNSNGNINLEGSNYRIKDNFFEIINNEGIDHLIAFLGGDKSNTMELGTRTEGTEEFTINSKLKNEENIHGLSLNEWNSLSKEEQDTIEWQKKNCK